MDFNEQKGGAVTQRMTKEGIWSPWESPRERKHAFARERLANVAANANSLVRVS